MGFKGHISESAFLVNESRSRRVELSRDRYAHLWVSDATRRLWDAFSKDVYPHDEIELGVRNRFFLERLDSFIASHANPVFVNLGAGFTSYPYLTSRECKCVEVDYAHVIDHKVRNVEVWRRKGVLPGREVDFVAADLANNGDRRRLKETLSRAMSGAQSFVLLEGLTYYLDRDLLELLFEMCRDLQESGSALAFDFWTPDSATHPVFLRFERFFAEPFGHRAKRYNFMDTTYVGLISGYRTVELSDVQELERMFSASRILQDRERILPESYAILRRSP